PWDHSAPLLRLVKSAGGVVVYEIQKVPTARLRVQTLRENVRGMLAPVPGKKDESEITISALEPGAHPYVLRVKASGKPLGEMTGTLVAAKWNTSFFKWPPSIDPRQNLEAYRKLVDSPAAVSVLVDE